MRYRVRHVSTYDYGAPVSVCHNFLMLSPREGSRVHCLSHRLVIRPTPLFSSRRTDSFGNAVHAFSIEESHRQLSISATSRVDVSAGQTPAATRRWEQVVAGVAAQTDSGWFAACPFVYESPRIQVDPAFAAYALESFTANRPVLEAALDLTSRIHRDFLYDKDATSVATPTREAFTIRRGVCQDFAHVQIASLRSIGIPVRYVSGYLRTLPKPGGTRMVGADQSHAWVSMYCGENSWIELDPTNDCVCSTDHIPIAWGRDYDDVVPVKGVILGGGGHHVSVSVDVSEESSGSPRNHS